MDISESGVKLLHSNGRKQLVVAEVPDTALDTLAALPAVTGISLDRGVQGHAGAVFVMTLPVSGRQAAGLAA